MNIKRVIFFIPIFSVFIFSCYFTDPLFPIKRMARSNDIDKKAEAGLMYDKVVKILTDAYRFNGSLNKDVGKRLMYNGNYLNAIKHLEIARDIRNKDPDIYYWLGICYINLYWAHKESLKLNIDPVERKKIEDELFQAEKNYLIALDMAPSYKEIYYSYAHLLAYAKSDYFKAKEVLNKYLFEISSKEVADVKALFLLGHVYAALEEYDNAYRTYEKIYQYRKGLSKDELFKLEQYISEMREKLGRIK